MFVERRRTKMKIFLMKTQKGFLEDLGEGKDFNVEIEHFEFDRWLEDREAENRIGKHVTIMPMVNFEQLIQLPLGKTDSGATIIDRYKKHTETMLNLYTVGATHAECSHVMFFKKW